MKKIIVCLFIVIILFGFSGCDLTKESFVGNDVLDEVEFNDLVSDEEYVLKVDNIELKNKAISINFIAGTEPLIRVKTDENVLETINLKLKENLLKITGSKKYKYDVDEFIIEIVNVKLCEYNLDGSFIINNDPGNYGTSLEINANGILTGEFNFKNVNEILDISVDGVISLNFINLSTKKIKLNLDGVIDFVGVGQAKNLEVAADGIVNLDFKELKVEVADLALSGTINSNFTAQEEFNLDLSGLGSIEYFGDPKKININKDGLASVSAGGN